MRRAAISSALDALRDRRRTPFGSPASKRLRNDSDSDECDDEVSDSDPRGRLFDEVPARASVDEAGAGAERSKRARRRQPSPESAGAASDGFDEAAFIADSDSEAGDGSGSGGSEAEFSHFAFDLNRSAVRESLQTEPGLGLLASFGESDGSWSRWSREASFGWYMRFLGTFVAWRAAPEVLRKQPLSVDARAYAACIRTWEGPMVHARETLVTSQAWAGKDWVRDRLATLPALELSRPGQSTAGMRCEICERRNHPATVVVTARGIPAEYDGLKVWDAGSNGLISRAGGWEQHVPRRAPSAATASSDPAAAMSGVAETDVGTGAGEFNDGDADDGPLAGDITTRPDGVRQARWVAGRYCAERVTLFSRLVHWKMVALVAAGGEVKYWARSRMGDDASDNSALDDEEAAADGNRASPSSQDLSPAAESPPVFDDDSSDSDQSNEVGASAAPAPDGGEHDKIGGDEARQLPVLSIERLCALFRTDGWERVVAVQRGGYEALFSAARGKYSTGATSQETGDELAAASEWSDVVREFGAGTTGELVPWFEGALPRELAAGAAAQLEAMNAQPTQRAARQVQRLLPGSAPKRASGPDASPTAASAAGTGASAAAAALPGAAAEAAAASPFPRNSPNGGATAAAGEPTDLFDSESEGSSSSQDLQPPAVSHRAAGAPPRGAQVGPSPGDMSCKSGRLVGSTEGGGAGAAPARRLIRRPSGASALRRLSAGEGRARMLAGTKSRLRQQRIDIGT